VEKILKHFTYKISPGESQLVEAAARKARLKRSSFVLAAAVQVARETLADAA